MVTRRDYIQGRQRAVERLANVDQSDREALWAALLVLRAYQRIPQMLPGWST